MQKLITYLKMFLIDKSRCFYCGSEYKGNVYFFTNVQDTLKKEMNFLNNRKAFVYLFTLTVFLLVVLTFHTT